MGQEVPLTPSSRDHPLRVVFDTNVVVSALVFGRRLAWLRTVWARGAVTPVVCRETTAELLRVLAYPKFRLDQADREALLEDYLPYAELAELPDPRPTVPIFCRDRDDMVFIELALAAGADLLVSGDGHLTELRKSLPMPRVVAVDEFRDRLGQVC